MRSLTLDFLGHKGGNVAITTALTMPLVIGALALGIDYGHLTLQQRQLQGAADLAAIAAAGNLAEPEKATLAYFALNNQDIAVRTDTGVLTKNGEIPFVEKEVLADHQAYAKLTKGRYVPDASKAVATRFEAGALPYDAVQVTLYQNGNLFFADSFAERPLLSAKGMAATDKVASFSIGSRLASLNDGILNALLGKLLGTTVSLKAMDYTALADAQVNLLKTLDALAIDLGLQAGTYSTLLKTDIAYGKLLNAIGKTTGVTPAVATILKTLETTVNKTKVTVKLEQLLALGPLSERLIGQNDNLAVNVGVFELVSAAATAANSGKQLALDLGTTIPGVGSSKVTLAIGEPPVGTPPRAVGAPGTIVRTAQTRLAVEVTIDGLAAIAGLKVRVPLYVEVAYAEAKLKSLSCSNGAATVEVEAVPGVAEIALGDVDTSAFANFGKDPRVTRVDLISTILLKISGMANATATNLATTKLTFSPSDIAGGKIKSISTKDTLTSLTTSLLGNLDLKIDLLNIPLAVPQPLLKGLADTLKIATVPLDTILYNTLLTLGVRIGEADIKVTGASCRNPVLVQ